jgi:lipoate-protein ligase A
MIKGRFIADPPGDGLWNMAVDAGLYNSAQVDDDFPPTLRVYGWNPPCISLGRRQDAGIVNADECFRRGVDVVKRIGGGAAVYHRDDVTYCFVSRRDRMQEPEPELWRLVFEKMLDNFRIEYDAVNSGVPSVPETAAAAACFAAAEKDEPTIKGKKWVGSARRKSRSVFLQHGSVLLSRQPDEFKELLAEPAEDGSVGLKEFYPGIDRGAVCDAMKISFGEILGVEFSAGQYTDIEMETAKNLLIGGKAL